MGSVLAWVKGSRKFLAGIVTANMTWWGAVIVASHAIGAQDYWNLAFANALALGIYNIPNDPKPEPPEHTAS